MWLKRKISPKNRISIPQDVMKQMHLEVGDNIMINVEHVSGEKCIVICSEKDDCDE